MSEIGDSVIIGGELRTVVGFRPEEPRYNIQRGNDAASVQVEKHK